MCFKSGYHKFLSKIICVVQDDDSLRVQPAGRAEAGQGGARHRGGRFQVRDQDGHSWHQTREYHGTYFFIF
jgi:hypothetical protein